MPSHIPPDEEISLSVCGSLRAWLSPPAVRILFLFHHGLPVVQSLLVAVVLEVAEHERHSCFCDRGFHFLPLFSFANTEHLYWRSCSQHLDKIQSVYQPTFSGSVSHVPPLILFFSDPPKGYDPPNPSLPGQLHFRAALCGTGPRWDQSRGWRCRPVPTLA